MKTNGSGPCAPLGTKMVVCSLTPSRIEIMASVRSNPGAESGCCAQSRSARRTRITRCRRLRVLHARELDVLDARLERDRDPIDVTLLIHQERDEAAQRLELGRVVHLEDVVVIVLEPRCKAGERQLEHRAIRAHGDTTIPRGFVGPRVCPELVALRRVGLPCPGPLIPLLLLGGFPLLCLLAGAPRPRPRGEARP